MASNESSESEEDEDLDQEPTKQGNERDPE